MTTSISIINTIIAGALVLGAAAPASADRVFPPSHLSPDAVFDTGTVSEQAVRDAWYHEGESDRRVSLKDNEMHETSPHPSMYYFVKIHEFGNPETNRLEKFRSMDSTPDVKIVDEERVAGDKS